ncbi:MAG: HAMP domain-containing histidine kinase [Lachnospiraceae bacterium]|nr:HAMP domain-containing histidine kinase [Lachnospiraceae bacterium]
MRERKAIRWPWRKKETARIKALTDYLEKVNTGGDGVLFSVGEDDFSKLQDEIYKTVTELHQTRDEALRARNCFAENLYNIAHQLKTPITSISLSTQMMYESPSLAHLEQIQKQLARLTHLEEALLLLSRIEAGTLSLERKKVDVFTLLMLAADNLQELFAKADVTVVIPELDEAVIDADLDWTMEAVMNLFKNCMEHTPAGGRVFCSYAQNPLYVEIKIWDTGSGFAKEDIPHLFERFYRGKNAKSGGIGIGLALAKAIIESQNGTITAGNPADGGACFEIHFYCH